MNLEGNHQKQGTQHLILNMRDRSEAVISSGIG